MNYFIPYGSKLYSAIAHVKPLYRYSATLMLLGMLFFLWFSLVYTTLENKIKLYQTQQIELQKQQCTIEHVKKDCTSLENTVTALKKTLNTYKERAAKTEQHYLSTLLQQAASSGLSLISYTTEHKKNKKWYNKNSMKCNFDGNMHQINHFFNTLKSLHAIIQCKQMTLTVNKNSSTLSCLLDYFSFA